VRGTAANDKITLRVRPDRPNKLEIDVGDDGKADLKVKRNRFDRIRVNGGRGDDQLRIDESQVVFTDTTKVVLDGGRDDDRLLGGRGNETLKGGPGNDVADGNQGSDTAIMAAGDDRFVWDPGDGSDKVEGRRGQDVLTFNGSAANENFAVAANGARARVTRDVGNIVMDLNDVERIDTAALGGADVLTVNDLSGTDVTEVATDLGAIDDNAADRIVANGTSGDDVITVSGSSGSAAVLGLAARVDVRHANPAQDDLTINALAGDDVIEASGLAANAIHLTGNGGDGDDVLIGGPGLDTLDGGPGDNIVLQD
jgi:Ca2+-binding RTX toxin-like protein